ncbi:MAG: hypothetical protein CMG71_01220 [Candidatus Marinimicrobia bacterium]|nr:hypothetical protein [Candidatus Neomarinimicrobiota bacterium]|tara:strand:- start:28482 stop:28808 length:327 start_codon:yes stop_codon:yes gene_type:complete
MFKNYANNETPVTSRNWKNLSEKERKKAVDDIIKANDYFKGVVISRALEDGHVFVTLNKDITVAERGKILLDFEEQIKNKLDKGITIWCEPLGDKNSLRKLRGIEIKT